MKKLLFKTMIVSLSYQFHVQCSSPLSTKSDQPSYVSSPSSSSSPSSTSLILSLVQPYKQQEFSQRVRSERRANYEHNKRFHEGLFEWFLAKDVIIEDSIHYPNYVSRLEDSSPPTKKQCVSPTDTESKSPICKLS